MIRTHRFSTTAVRRSPVKLAPLLNEGATDVAEAATTPRERKSCWGRLPRSQARRSWCMRTGQKCNTNPGANGCGYGTKVAGSAVLSAGLVGLLVGPLTWR
jgi:hypothetical protein